MMTSRWLFAIFLIFASSSQASVCSIILTSLSIISPVKDDLVIGATSLYSASEERTFVAIKPDAVQRNLIGEIIKRVEQKGLKVIGLKILRPSTELVSEHYSEHKDQYFFKDLVNFFLSGPIVALVLEGCNAIHVVRKLVGKTQPEDADAGTIRGDYCFGKGRNLVHASDTAENAKKEIELWFTTDELISYSKTIDQWIKLQPPPVI